MIRSNPHLKRMVEEITLDGWQDAITPVLEKLTDKQVDNLRQFIKVKGNVSNNPAIIKKVKALADELSDMIIEDIRREIEIRDFRKEDEEAQKAKELESVKHLQSEAGKKISLIKKKLSAEEIAFLGI